jgi:hypothetical protein
MTVKEGGLSERVILLEEELQEARFVWLHLHINPFLQIIDSK